MARREAMLKFWANAEEGIEGFRVSPEEFTDLGNHRVLVVARSRGAVEVAAPRSTCESPASTRFGIGWWLPSAPTRAGPKPSKPPGCRSRRPGPFLRTAVSRARRCEVVKPHRLDGGAIRSSGVERHEGRRAGWQRPATAGRGPFKKRLTCRPAVGRLRRGSHRSRPLLTGPAANNSG
jgi:hypothetical protein